MYSIIIPSFRNPEYLKLCIESILNNSYYKTHQICIHLDGYDKDSIEYLNTKDIHYTMSSKNLGVPRAFNVMVDNVECDELLFAHDDFYFTKNWDYNLHRWTSELDKKFPDYSRLIGYRLCEPKPGSFPPICDCGKTIQEFNNDISRNKLDSYIKENCSHEVGGNVDKWTYHSSYPTKISQLLKWSTDINACADLDFSMKFIRHFKRNNLKFLMFSVKDIIIYHFQTVATPKSKLPQTGCEKFKEKWNMGWDTARKFIEYEVERSKLLLKDKL